VPSANQHLRVQVRNEIPEHERARMLSVTSSDAGAALTAMTHTTLQRHSQTQQPACLMCDGRFGIQDSKCSSVNKANAPPPLSIGFPFMFRYVNSMKARLMHRWLWSDGCQGVSHPPMSPILNFECASPHRGFCNQ
jgi:hypothetical protein